MIEANVSFHGHSDYSDGLDSVDKLVTHALKSQINYFGISDHNTTSHISPFYESLKKLSNGFKVIPVASVEISFFDDGKELDIIFAKPGEVNQKFIDWCEYCCKNRQKIDVFEAITKNVKEFNGLVVVVHPAMFGAPSAPFYFLEKLAKKLNDDVKKNIGVEVKNWTANIFPSNKIREAQLKVIVERLGLAQFGFADFHTASEISKQFTLAEVEDLTPKGLVEAVQKRRVQPLNINSVNIFDWLRLFKNISSASIKYRYFKSHKTSKS